MCGRAKIAMPIPTLPCFDMGTPPPRLLQTNAVSKCLLGRPSNPDATLIIFHTRYYNQFNPQRGHAHIASLFILTFR